MVYIPSIADFLTESWLRSTPPDRYFWRGVSYMLEDRVDDLRIATAEVTGRVRGSQTYTTRLTVTDGALSWYCSCPVDDSQVCKHLVATGLEYRDTFHVRAGEPPKDWLQDRYLEFERLSEMGPGALAGICRTYATLDPTFRGFLWRELVDYSGRYYWHPQATDSDGYDA